MLLGGMGEQPMPGGWSLSMAWTPMCGQTWTQAAVSFTGMWTAMMAVMMLPVLAPLAWRRGAQAIPLAAGYLGVWALAGALLFAAGSLLAAALLASPVLARAVPAAAACVIVAGGVFQCSTSKRRLLACCRGAMQRCAGWRGGIRLGGHCCASCAGLTAILLAVGAMHLHAMAAVTLAVALERLAPHGERVAFATGVLALAAGLGQLVGAAAAAWRPLA